MVGLLGLAIGIVGGLLSLSGYDATFTRQSAGTETMIIVAYLVMDMASFLVSVIALWKMDVEKFADEDRKAIIERQKAAVLAEGGTWIEPEERERLAQEKANQEAEEARKAELRAKCEKLGLNFEEEEKKYQEKLAYKKVHPSLIDKLMGN